MARRVNDSTRGDYLPQLADGIRERTAFLADAFPGIGTPHLDRLDRGVKVPMTTVDAWSALYAVDQLEAESFARRHGGNPLDYSGLVFEFNPSTALLRRCEA